MSNIKLLLFLGLIFILSCQPTTSSDTLFHEMPNRKTGITFKNILRETKEFNVLKYSYFYNGGGVAIGDLNNDDLPDIYFTGNLMASHLYLNKGDWEFEEIAEDAGVAAAGLWNTGVTLADVNGDGWLDIYVCRSAAVDPNARRNLLFINNGDLTFTEQAFQWGIADPAYSTQAAFFDYDQDNDLDLFLLNHSVPEYSNFQTSIGRFKAIDNPNYGDKLYRNDGGKFVDVTKSAGIITNVLGFGLGVTIDDFNGDNWLDIYVSNDFNEEDYYYLNNQDGTFTESLSMGMDHVSLFSMGADAADVNNDGQMDLLTLDMLPEDNYRIKMTSGADNHDKYRLLLQQGFYPQSMRNMLQLNRGGGQFQEIGQIAGVSNTDWSWSALFADYDLDGWQDLFVTNGYLRDYTNMDFLSYTVDLKLKTDQSGEEVDVENILEKMPKIDVPNRMFKNSGALKFEDVGNEWGFGKARLSNGAAYGDLDNDGDLDLVINNVNEIATVYRNQTLEQKSGNFCKIKLISKDPVIGAKVEVITNQDNIIRRLMPTRGYQSSVEPILHYGLGNKATSIGNILVTWTDGKMEQFGPQPINEYLKLEKGAGNSGDFSVDDFPTVFSPIDLPIFKHQEDNFNDFKVQGLLPKFYSRQGPPITKGDVNGDGWPDLIVGGAKDQPLQVLLASRNGSFTSTSASIWKEDQSYEDTGLKLIDVDGDQDLDLVVVSGGNYVKDGDPAYQARLYLNNGKGRWTKSNGLGAISINANTITGGDFDNDGDADLFIGGLYAGWQYPFPSGNRLLINDGKGTFSTAKIPSLESIHVSEAEFIDFNQDGQMELVTVGEWEPLSIWTYQNGGWSRFYKGQESGWWNTLKCVNLDNDPELEIIAGNYGLNSQLIATKDQPLINYYADFDQNGSVDPILTCYNGGESYPFLSRDDVLSQLPGLKKYFTDYQSYAQYTSKDLLEKLETYESDTINYLQTVIYDWNGKKFTPIVLPKEIQVSSVHSIEAIDIDQDGDKDLIFTGNDLYNRVKIGEMDANHGVLLQNLGNLEFNIIPNQLSGLSLKGAVRSCQTLTIKGEDYLFFGINDSELKGYVLNTNQIQ